MKIRILHLGLGRFHKAHQAVYYQRLFEELNEEWAVAAFSMRSPEASDRLRSVQQKYPVVELGQNRNAVRWVNIIEKSFFAIRDKDELKKYFCSPEVTLVTLTVTEKAYTQGIFSEDGVISILFAGLQSRKIANAGPLTVLSCDNLRENGIKLKNAVLQFAEHAGQPEMDKWINEYIKFPNSVVDRIVPALTEKRLRELQVQFNLPNDELTATEFFSQWIIENNFNLPFPPLEKLGVQIVRDVLPYEEIKLFLLNASHSYLAYSGILKNYKYVHEAVKDQELANGLHELHQEILPFLRLPDGFDVQNYLNQMLSRFNNSELPHQLQQIAMDGSQKLQQRIIPILKKAVESKSSKRQLEACVEFWMEYCFKNVPDDPLKKMIEDLKLQCDDYKEFISKFKQLYISSV